jgi:hypothetical protein
MSLEQRTDQNQSSMERKPQVIELNLGTTAVEVTATPVPVADRGPYGADHFRSFGGLGLDSYADFAGKE